MGATARKMDTDDSPPDDESLFTKGQIIDGAKSVMARYFANKPYYCGGEIPQHLLFADKRVNLVLDCSFDRAMDIADESLEKELTDEDHATILAGGVSPNTKMLIALIRDMEKSGVPQEMSSGMLVLYLELCMGIDVVYA